MHRIFLADTDRGNIKTLSGFLMQKKAAHNIWENNIGYQKFLDESESAIVFIRIDNCDIPGLELTQVAVARSSKIHVVWMAESDAYAVDAFRYGAEAYLLLPATEETLNKVLKSLNFARNSKNQNNA